MYVSAFPLLHIYPRVYSREGPGFLLEISPMAKIHQATDFLVRGQVYCRFSIDVVWRDCDHEDGCSFQSHNYCSTSWMVNFDRFSGAEGK